ncbi:hypothetical protein ACUN3E_05210 [Streptomyces sp. Ju416(a)]|uniref:hypothetical protein n=1 Tax=Streptomyces sp. Ju416(a) TaxID=3446591 RepID=UPI00403D8549
MIPAPTADLYIHFKDKPGHEARLMGWTEKGHPMVLTDRGTLHTVDPDAVESVETAHAEAIIPGGGWHVAGTHDGKVWVEPVIAWRFVNGYATPVLAEPGSLTIADTDTNRLTTKGMWLVAPGENPGTARGRIEEAQP